MVQKIKIAGVKRTTAASGATYYYHRATGQRIKEPPGTAAFLARKEELDRRVGTGQDNGPAPAPGTLGAMITAYRASPEFEGLAPRTKADYRGILDYLQPLAPMLPREVDGPFAIRVRNRAKGAHGWRFAIYTVQVLRLLFSWAVQNGYAEVNKIRGVPHLKRPRDMPRQNRAWTQDEIAVVLEAATGGIRVAVALGAYLGMRQGDVLKLLWSARHDGGAGWVQGKTGDPVWVPELSALTTILDAEPKRGIHIVARRDGQPYTSDGFRAIFHRLIRGLGAKGKVGTGLTFHGLRITAATTLADAGLDDRTIAAVTGHRSPAMVRAYTEGADRRRRARLAIDAVEGNKNKQQMPDPVS